MGDKTYADFYITDEDGDKLEVTFTAHGVAISTDDNRTVYLAKKDIGAIELIIAYLKEESE